MRQLFGSTRAKLQERRQRRSLMFWITLTLLALWFLGRTFLQSHLASSPAGFLLYWSAVTGLAIGLILLSCYDMLQVTRELRQERRLPKLPR